MQPRPAVNRAILLVMLHCLDLCLHEEDLCLVLSTTDAVTSRYTNTRAYIQCTNYDEAGTGTPVKCSAGNIKQCAEIGTVGCTLHYRDVNVTTALKIGKTLRLCNTAWVEFIAFDRVAYVKGSALAAYTGPGSVNTTIIHETEAYALMQVLRAVDRNVTVDWAVSQAAVTGCIKDMSLTTPGGYTVRFFWICPSRELGEGFAALRGNVQTLTLEVTDGPQDSLLRHPTLDEHLVTALLGLLWLNGLTLTVGCGYLLPQLGSLANMAFLYVQHYCLRGQLPAQLLKTWSIATVIDITGELGYYDTAGSEPCGLSASLPARNSCGLGGCNPERLFTLDNNRVTGDLPEDLLAWGGTISLAGNQFSGTVPGAAGIITALSVDLFFNQPEVSAAALLLLLLWRFALLPTSYKRTASTE
jgi:hypothetical protein